MRHSFIEAILPLSIRDDVARKRYFTGDGLLRLGPILEDLDVFGGFIANEHLKQMHLRAGILVTCAGNSSTLIAKKVIM